MKSLVCLVLLSSLVSAGPILVTAPPKFVPTTTAKTAHALCVTIAGVDWDIEQIDAEYKRAWTWPGMTESSLKAHLREHDVTGFDGLSFEQLQRIHAVIHERESVVQDYLTTENATFRQPRIVQPATIRSSRTVQSCPGGECPQYRSTRQGWFSFRRR